MGRCGRTIMMPVLIKTNDGGGGGGGDATLNIALQDLTVSLYAQTQFELLYYVQEKFEALVYVNGQQMDYGTDFTISGNMLNFINTDFELETTDKVNIQYQY